MKGIITTFFGLVFSVSLLAQLNPGDPWFGESCTSIMAGKAATVDGSVITAHTCDGNYRTWLRMEKAAEHADTALYQVYKGTLHTENPWDMRNVELAGEIPQVAKTFAYLNTAYPSMNEKQLAMGETTFVGPDTLRNKNGMFLIEELQRIALQRCDNARDAIILIGGLVTTYGYGDWGECITIADKHEVWQMEILGAGPDEVSGVWAAQRIPDEHVGISANISRIGVIDHKNPDYFMASDNIEKVAKKYGLWNGKGVFKFWKAYANQDKPFKIREFYVLSTLAPSLELSMDMEELPFSVKPDEKVSLQTISALYRATYEGTPYDMTQNIKMVKKRYEDHKVVGEDTITSPIAHPWPTGDFRNTMNYLQEDMVEYQRTVAVSWCSYSHIIQLRDWLPDEVGGVAWFSFDNPAESPRVPIFAGANDLPESFNYCGQKRYRADAAIWDYRQANKLATVGWGKTKNTIEESVLWFEEKAAEELPLVENKAEELLQEGKKEEAAEYLTNYLRDFEAATKNKWELLETKFWEMFGRGF